MIEDESIDDMITKFTKYKWPRFLGDEIGNDQKVRKVIRALPPSWDVKSTILKELNDKEEIELNDLIGNLKTHEMKRKTREEKVPQKKKTLAFKSTPTISDDEIDDQEDDEDLSLLVKNVRRMYYKAKFNNRRRWQGKEEKKIVSYTCRKPEHVIADCLDTKSKPTTSKRP